jgi:hypothetical protein
MIRLPNAAGLASDTAGLGGFAMRLLYLIR